MTRFAIGDIHGRLEALKQVFERSGFDYDEDLLIILGDIVDGGYDTAMVVEELLKIKNKVFIMGNHDEFFVDHLKTGWSKNIWLNQGGKNTVASYGGEVHPPSGDLDFYERFSGETEPIKDVTVPVTHQEFFNNAVYYYELDNMLFVHAGINPKIPNIESQSKHDLTWDRHMIEYAKKKKVLDYDKIFIGHSTTQNIEKGNTDPIKLNNVWCLDTGAGWDGKLTLMDIDTEEYWQSDRQEPAGR